MTEQEFTDKLVELSDELEELYFDADDLIKTAPDSTAQLEGEFLVKYLASKEKQIRGFRIKLEKLLADYDEVEQ